MITLEREQKFKDTIAKRQFDLTIILEDVHDPHNIGAVLRTCDSVGVGEVFIKAPDQFKTLSSYLRSTATARGAAKWVKINFFTDIQECLETVKKKGFIIYGTHLDKEAKSLYSLDLTEKVALFFGNEHAGISQDALKYIQKNFIIPQVGLVKSLNISVACAVSLYEAYRQRAEKGGYNNKFSNENTDHKNLYDRYVSVHRGINSSGKLPGFS